MSVVGSEAGRDARRVDADSSGARDGIARLSVRPLRGVELRMPFGRPQRALRLCHAMLQTPMPIELVIC